MYFFGSKQYYCSHSDWYRNTVYFCISFPFLSSKSQRSKEIWHGQARLARSRLLDSLTPNVVSDIDVFLVLWPWRKPAHRQCRLVPLLSNKRRKKNLDEMWHEMQKYQNTCLYYHRNKNTTVIFKIAIAPLCLIRYWRT